MSEESEDRRKRINALYANAPVTAPQLVPGGYPVPLFEREDEAAFDEIGVFLQKGVVELMRRGRGGFNTTAYIFCREDPYGGDEPDPLYSVSITKPEGHRAKDVKNALGLLAHVTAMIGHARAVAFVMEAWAVRGPKPEGAGSLEFVPGRMEIVMAMLETASTTRAWHGPVTRYGGRGVTIGAFEKWPSDTEAAGRFAGVMREGYDPEKAAIAAGDIAG